MSPPRFLIDENLSTALPQRAHAYGYEASHVTQLGLKGAIHPGVVFIVPNVRRTGQIELFGAALDEVQRGPDLVNAAIEPCR